MPQHTPDSDLVPSALAELGRIVYAQRELPSILEEISDVTLRAVSGSEAVSITLIEGDRATTASSTSDLALRLDERQYEYDEGPCLDAARGGEIMHVPDMASEQRYPEYAPRALELGIQSSVSVPLPVQQAVIGALNIYATRPHAFDPVAVEAASRFGSYAAVALANARLYARTAQMAREMHEALASRAIIDQAKGILMALHGGTAEQAFSRIVRESQRRNIKVREIAADIVRRAQTPRSTD